MCTPFFHTPRAIFISKFGGNISPRLVTESEFQNLVGTHHSRLSAALKVFIPHCRHHGPLLGRCAACKEVINDARVGKGGRVTQLVLLTCCDLAQHPAHDLAAPGLGERCRGRGRERNVSASSTSAVQRMPPYHAEETYAREHRPQPSH